MNAAQDIRKTKFHVAGLCCGTEEQLIRRKLQTQPGIHELQFDILTHTLKVGHTCAEKEITKSLGDIGFAATEIRKPIEQKTPPRQLFTTALSGSFLLSGGLFGWLNFPEYVSTSLFLLSILAGGWQFAIKGYKAVRHLSLDMNFLMSIAAIGAVAIGEYAEGAAVVFLFALSLLLESLSIDRGRTAIQSLMKLAPSVANVRKGVAEVTMDVEDIRLNETIIIRPGERIPLDAVVTSGSSSVDQSTITGEPLPAAKNVGDAIFAGTFNQRGALEARVTKLANDTTLARIIQLVEEAQSKKAQIQTFTETFARYYTPVVFALAVGIAILPPLVLGQAFGDWFYRALVLLVIACPCALVISTPVAVMSSLTAAARRGVLIKGGRFLEALANINAIAFDKTGTLTEGKPTLTDIVCLNSLSEQDVLRIVTAVEVKSEHPLADAFLRKSAELQLPLDSLKIEQFEAIPGKGVQATISGKTYVVGSHQLIEELGVCSPTVEEKIHKLEEEGKSTILLTDRTQVLGVLAVSDNPRLGSRQLADSLRSLGIQHISMLTGDSKIAARTISEKLSLDEHGAELLPENKLAAIENLKSRHGAVAMVGDGVNDAPALAAADIGIAMGAAGSDTALETADVVLMSDDLAKIPEAIKLGKRTLGIIKQNVIIALATKAVFLGLGVLGMTSLWLALLADDGATLVVILNAFRLLKKQ
ncbi:MAG: cadmium-translocating P-type ATPase [Ignavibacteriae bacterium]|nr:cadmium-translocating P-type ATPase [Ignavibacteriota bacterium]